MSAPHEIASGDAISSDEIRSIFERVHDIRFGLFDCAAIVDLARRAISSDEDWYLRRCLEVVVTRLDAACMDLELIALDASAPKEAGHE